MLVCKYCKNNAVYHIKYSGELVCKKHFIKLIEKRVRKSIRRLIRPNMKIGLAVSGGKDSLVMAYIVKRIVAKIPNIELIALIVDEEVSNNRKKAIETALKNLNEWRINYRLVRFSDFYPYNIRNLMQERPNMACTFCGVLRRRVLNILALKEKLNVIFTGHNATDIAQTILLNVIQGNIKHLIRELPLSEELIPRYYPLKNILEKEVAFYAFLRKIEYFDGYCPYIRYSIRNEVRSFLNQLEERHPGITFNIIRLGEKIKQKGTAVKLKKCKYCNYPSVGDICKVCEIVIKYLKKTPTRKYGLSP